MATTLSELLRRKRQFEATGRRITRRETAGIVSGSLQAQNINALRSRSLSLQQQQFDKRLALEQERLETEELAGFIQTGALVATSEPGKAFAGQLSRRLGIGGRPTPTPTTLPSTTVGAAPLVGGGGATTGAQTIGPLGQIIQGPAEGVGIGAGTEAGTTVAGAEAGAGFSNIATPLLVGTAVKLGTQALGANQELSNVAGGASAGFVVAGPIGAVVGAVLGLVGGEIADTIICTELHRQGYINDAILELDGQFGAEVDAQVHAGYVILASPIVNLMRKSKSFTWLVSRLAMPWIEQMTHEIRPEEYRSNIIGKAIMKVGIPICRLGGKYGKLRQSFEHSYTGNY